MFNYAKLKQVTECARPAHLAPHLFLAFLSRLSSRPTCGLLATDSRETQEPSDCLYSKQSNETSLTVRKAQERPKSLSQPLQSDQETRQVSAITKAILAINTACYSLGIHGLVSHTTQQQLAQMAEDRSLLSPS